MKHISECTGWDELLQFLEDHREQVDAYDLAQWVNHYPELKVKLHEELTARRVLKRPLDSIRMLTDKMTLNKLECIGVASIDSTYSCAAKSIGKPCGRVLRDKDRLIDHLIRVHKWKKTTVNQWLAKEAWETAKASPSC